MIILLQEKLKVSCKSWAFHYFDDEGDMVFVSMTCCLFFLVSFISLSLDHLE